MRAFGISMTLAVLGLHACAVKVGDYPVATGQLGEPCDAANSCGPGLDCWGVDLVPFGAPRGVCTVWCASDADCPSEGGCVATEAGNACLVRCTHADGTAGKCRGRRDVGCSVSHFCEPRCSGDADCSGRYCDYKTGLCGDTPTPSTALGPQAGCMDGNTCRGDCLDVGLLQLCREECVVGSPTACEYGGDGGYTYGCGDVAGTGAKIGDLGNCARQCGCNDECGSVRLLCNVQNQGVQLCSLLLTMGDPLCD